MTRPPLQKSHLRELFDLMMFDDDPEKFDMLVTRHKCGTPACLLGHGLQHWPALWHRNGLAFFGITLDEWAYLFGAEDDDGVRFHDTPSIAASRVLDVLYADVGE